LLGDVLELEQQHVPRLLALLETDRAERRWMSDGQGRGDRRAGRNAAIAHANAAPQSCRRRERVHAERSRMPTTSPAMLRIPYSSAPTGFDDSPKPRRSGAITR
jgi:hypothetical protein